MILIADSGSTKTNWCLADKEGGKVFFTTEGYNPNYVTSEYLLESLSRTLPTGYEWKEVGEVYFYGAGCSEDRYEYMRNALQHLFVSARIEIAMDLLAAARALLGNEPGFAAILGTGTNSCIYDGEKIIRNIDSLGFILGDEGSGGYIGKQILRDYIRGYMPEDIRTRFWETYRITGDEIIEQVYTKPFANRYCASFCRFITEYEGQREYLLDIVQKAFYALFENIVTGYSDYSSYTFNCVGSIAWHFKDILVRVASEYGMQLGDIVAYPMDNLIKYHINNMR